MKFAVVVITALLAVSLVAKASDPVVHLKESDFAEKTADGKVRRIAKGAVMNGSMQVGASRCA